MSQMLDGLPIRDSGENIDTFGILCDVALLRPGAKFSVDDVGNALVEIINRNGNLLSVDLSDSTKTIPLQKEV